jgi:hypothetical protein
MPDQKIWKTWRTFLNLEHRKLRNGLGLLPVGDLHQREINGG